MSSQGCHSAPPGSGPDPVVEPGKGGGSDRGTAGGGHRGAAIARGFTARPPRAAASGAAVDETGNAAGHERIRFPDRSAGGAARCSATRTGRASVPNGSAKFRFQHGASHQQCNKVRLVRRIAIGAAFHAKISFDGGLYGDREVLRAGIPLFGSRRFVAAGDDIGTLRSCRYRRRGRLGSL